MPLFFTLLVLFGSTSFISGSGQHVTCERSYYKLGCYQDRQWSRAMSELLISDRVESNQGQRVDWNNWEDYLHGLACRCSQAASQRGYTMFGLQHYGECWSGPDSCDLYSRHGDSQLCIGKNYTRCDINDESECVGESNANFVYLLLEEPEEEHGI